MDKVKKFFCTIKWESFITAILAVVVGIVFLANPTNAGDVVCYIAGVAFTLLGALMLLKFFFNEFLFGSYVFVLSALLLTVGMLCLFKTSGMREFFVLMFGFFMIIDGVTKFQNGIDLMQSKVKYAWTVFLVGALSVVLGVIVLFGDYTQLMVFCGIALIIDGLCDMFVTIVFSGRVRRLEKRVRKLINDNFDEMKKTMNEDIVIVEENNDANEENTKE